jgi:hypothetical protein
LKTIDDYSGPDWLMKVGTEAFPGDPEWNAVTRMLEAVNVLLNALESTRDLEKRRTLLDTLDRDDFWMDAPGAAGLLPALMVAVELLGHLETSDPDRCLLVCARVVELLRTRINHDNLSALDRLRLARLTTVFRRRLVSLGHTLTLRERDSDRAGEVLSRFVCWDAELGQRVVLERFLYATPASGWDGSEEPIPGRAFTPRRIRNAWPSANAAESLGCFDRQDGPVCSPISRQAPGLLPIHSDDRDHMLESLREGVEEKQLAEMLGDDQLLLRVGFATSGQLVWSLVGRDGDRLDDRRQGWSPEGVDARKLITSAVRRHDDALREGWEGIRLAEKWDHVRFLAKRPDALFTTRDWNEVARWARRLIERLGEFRLSLVRDRLRQRFPGLAVTGAAVDPGIDAEDWCAFWSVIAAERLDAQTLERRLDRATSELLRQVAEVWPQHDLAAALDGAAEFDLIFQAEDVLFSVPVAFLEHEGRLLFERVRSVRSALSLALLDWLGESDVQAFAETLDDPDRVLSLSWFKNDDLAARQGAELLHRGHRELARARRWESRVPTEWYCAADLPRGTHACLARGLRTHTVFRIVSVCGHGRSDLSGIELGDGIWNGSSVIEKQDDSWRARDACDLLGIELLIQVSCSIGRVGQAELQDVEGFCVELSVNRSRSVLAGLWPLHSEHSPRFANRVAEHYLRLRGEAVRDALSALDALTRDDTSISGDAFQAHWVSSRLSAARPRARAVAAARRDWLVGFREGRGSVGLNTVAAFELFGLG